MATNYGTSGGIGIEGDITIANARSAFNTSKKNALASIGKVCDGVDNGINNIIQTLADNQEYMLAEALVSAYYEGHKTVPPDFGIPSNVTLGRNTINAANAKAVATVQTIRENINLLQSLGSSMSATDVKSTYSQAVGAIKSAFNNLGGFMHEVGFTFAALNAAVDGEKFLKKSNEEIKKIVQSTPGGAFYAH